jgi:hypothetical protein
VVGIQRKDNPGSIETGARHEPSKKHCIRGTKDAEALLDKGVIKMGESVGFIDPSRIDEAEYDEFEAHGGMYRPVPGLSMATVELLVACAFREPHWIGGPVWDGLESKEDREAAVRNMDERLAELIALGASMAGSGKRAEVEFRDGLEMVGTVKAWFLRDQAA